MMDRPPNEPNHTLTSSSSYLPYGNCDLVSQPDCWNASKETIGEVREMDFLGLFMVCVVSDHLGWLVRH